MVLHLSKKNNKSEPIRKFGTDFSSKFRFGNVWFTSEWHRPLFWRSIQILHQTEDLLGMRNHRDLRVVVRSFVFCRNSSSRSWDLSSANTARNVPGSARRRRRQKISSLGLEQICRLWKRSKSKGNHTRETQNTENFRLRRANCLCY